MIGRRIGSWIIERELGQGGMGSVYEARHATLQTRAAVKVLSAGLESEETFRLRFRREAELQAQLRHPNVARVLDYLEDGGRWFLVIEFVDGGSLAAFLASGNKATRQQAIAWTRQALAGLAHAHQKGIVHRDIKPANLLLSASGEIVVSDFGIARAEGAAGLTSTGATVGTPHYMSPEQIVSPERVDARSDIYSLGIVLYELLAGKKPFDADSQFSVLQAQVSTAPPPLRTIDPAIPPQFESLVLRALAKNPGERFEACDAMIRELDRLSAAPPVDGGTIQASRLFVPAAVASSGALSPDEARNRRRRSFQRKLALGAAATVAVAGMLAARLSNDDAAVTAPVVTVTQAPPPAPPPNITTTHEAPEKPPASVVKPQPVRPVENNVIPPTVTMPPATTTALSPAPITPAPVTPAPPHVMPLPERPRIAVIGMGTEPLLAGSLEQEMERRLAQFDVADERGDPAVSDLLDKNDKSVSHQALGAALLKGGFHVLVLVRVVEGRREDVHRFGVEGSVIAARIHLNAYLLPANRSLGPGWTETVEYVETAAEGKARQAFIGATADLRKAINDEWAALRARR